MAEARSPKTAFSCPELDGLGGFSPRGSSDGLPTPLQGSPYRTRSRLSHRTEPFIIGVAGGTASGKTTVCDLIMQNLHGERASGRGITNDSDGWEAATKIVAFKNSTLQISASSCSPKTLSTAV